MTAWKKIPREGIFGSKFEAFLIYRKFCIMKSLKVLLSIIAIVFSDFSLKITK